MIVSVVVSVASVLPATVMPVPDPLGYPIPAYILQAISYLTFSLHLLAMNFTVGGAILLLWSMARKKSEYDGAAFFLGSSLPLGLSYVITLGIPPLLIVQVLYGQMFYSSSILVGSFWILTIPALTAAYAGYYFHKFKRDDLPRFQWLIVSASLLLMLYVGFLLVNNLTLSWSPEKWLAMYRDNPGGGTLNFSERSLHPRYTLFLGGAFAMAAIGLIWRGTLFNRWGHDKEGTFSQRFGRNAFILSPIFWGISALGVYMTRTDSIIEMFEEVNATVPLMAIGAVGFVLLAAGVFLSVGKKSWFYPLLASLGMFVVMTSAVVFRDLARLKTLEPYFTLDSVPIEPQWGMFVMFVIALLLGAGLLVFLSFKVFPNIAALSRERFERRIANN